MAKHRKLTKTQKILLLPAMAIVFAAGWVMAIGGDRRGKQRRVKPQRIRPKDDGVTFLPAVLEQEEEIVAR